MKDIIIRGAREHNLKNFDLVLPRDKFIVITGLSGSGKSTLAFDTLYAEGQRRYVESLSAYARQFLGLMNKPDVDSIEGLSPAISIEQKTTSKNPRSTVGTVTEIYDYLRLLFARVGTMHCPQHGIEIQSQSPERIAHKIQEAYKGDLSILAPIIRQKKGTYEQLIKDFGKEGYVRARVNGKIILYADTITESMQLAMDETKRRRELQIEHNKKHHITPKTIIRKIEEQKFVVKDTKHIPKEEKKRMIPQLEKEMKQAADSLDFEYAIALRDRIEELKKGI